jgi:polysaccharide export outer membrane protein
MRCDMRVFLRTRAFTLIACVFVMSSFISCISGGPGATPTVPVPDSGYTLGPEDVLLISVWKDEHLTREVVVRPDGMISFPLVGDVPPKVERWRNCA